MTMPTLLSLRLRDESGASLVEVLLAVTIMAGLAGVMGLAVNRSMPDDMDRTGQVINRLASAARLFALEDQKPVVLDLAGRTFSLHRNGMTARPGSESLTIPETISIRMLSAYEFSGSSVARILFLPDGRSSGGKLEFTNGNNRQVLEIDSQTSLSRRVAR